MINKTKQNFDKVIELLEKNGSSFAIATVIRTMSSTAAKPGMKAVSYTHLTLPTRLPV